MDESQPCARVAPFVGLTVVLSLPLWLLAAWVQAEPLPGLPLSALMAFCPGMAALILLALASGPQAARTLLARTFDLRRMRGHWAWAAMIGLMPAVATAGYGLQRAGGLAGAGDPSAAWAPLLMLAVFFAAALGEELGWSGYVLEPMQRRWGELAAALVLGALWTAWHVLPFLQADRSADWIAWQSAKTVAVRVVMVRLYLGSGRSLFAVTLFHALDNVAAFSLPLYGAAYDPQFTALAVSAIALAMFVGRRTHGGRRNGSLV
ncbi:CPBP family intramembrane glutamic endopeptidase [uncultured Phenylobacterium sp.]|uniref:CPBP family intramembrane glutamic endopeptidase n=1 Tax=uncultured Phenylobacterium sp. TaxID=349273 RepID=UPI0025D6882D|nr:CPBP family intramembrane glutamic endopeptidase [uncultured Phenylobacterium sp.]